MTNGDHDRRISVAEEQIRSIFKALDQHNKRLDSLVKELHCLSISVKGTTLAMKWLVTLAVVLTPILTAIFQRVLR